MSTELSLDEYQKLLARHDWFFDFADDPRAHGKGQKEQSLLRSIASSGGDLFKLAYNEAEAKRFKTKDFPNYAPHYKISSTEPATLAVRSENQTNTNDNEPNKDNMNTLLKPIGAILTAIIFGIIAAGRYLQDSADLDIDLDGAEGAAAAGGEAAPKTRRRRSAAAATETPPATGAAATATPATPATTAAPAAAAGEDTAESLRALASPLVEQSRGGEVKTLCARFMQADGVTPAINIGTLQPKDYKAFRLGIEALLM